MCKEVTALIVGGLIDTDIHHFQTVPEAPKDYFSNHHVDMVIIDRINRKFMMIEYKLNNTNALANQLANRAGSRVMGIINSIPRSKFPDIFPYDGSDRMLGIILNATRQWINFPTSYWNSIYSGFGMIYWWGYVNQPSSLEGGTGINDERPTFHHLFKRAVTNLQNSYGWKLKETEVLAILKGAGYGESTMVKHYRTAMKMKANSNV